MNFTLQGKSMMMIFLGQAARGDPAPPDRGRTCRPKRGAPVAGAAVARGARDQPGFLSILKSSGGHY